jgi:ABC-2 type transport system permease protein
MGAFCDKLLAVLRRDLRIQSRYRGTFLMHAVSMLTQIAGAYYLARAVGPQFRPDGIAYFPFLLVGTSITQMVIGGVQSFVSSMNQAQLTGTVEVMLTTSTPTPQIVLLQAASSFLGHVAQAIIYVAVGLVLFRVPVFVFNLPSVALLTALCLLIALAFGFIGAGLQLVYKRAGALPWLLGSVAVLFSGAMFPISALPVPLRLVGRMFPVTYALDGLRAALFSSGSYSTIFNCAAVLAVWVAVLLPLGLLILAASVRKARLDGTLSFY